MTSKGFLREELVVKPCLITVKNLMKTIYPLSLTKAWKSETHCSTAGLSADAFSPCQLSWLMPCHLQNLHNQPAETLKLVVRTSLTPLSCLWKSSAFACTISPERSTEYIILIYENFYECICSYMYVALFETAVNVYLWFGFLVLSSGRSTDKYPSQVLHLFHVS